MTVCGPVISIQICNVKLCVKTKKLYDAILIAHDVQSILNIVTHFTH